jgi:hypothetical protein
MNEIQESKPLFELLAGALMTLAMAFFKLTQRGHERAIAAMQKEIAELRRDAATKGELAALYREQRNMLIEIRKTVTRSHERIDEVMVILLEREKKQ